MQIMVNLSNGGKKMISTAIIYNVIRGLAFNVVLPLWCVVNHIVGV